MGKKHVVAQTEQELLKEKDVKKIETAAPKIQIQEGRVYIFSSYNNTIMTLADTAGNILFWVSSGSLGFKGSKKATPFAASKVAESVADMAKKLGVKEVKVFVKGIGSGRESAIRSLAARGLEISSIKDATPMPHNGCRPPKVRRV